MRRTFAVLLCAAALASATALTAQDKPVPPAKPVFDADGTVHVPAFDLPPSAYLTPEALAFQKARAKMGGMIPPADISIGMLRKGLSGLLMSFDHTSLVIPFEKIPGSNDGLL